MIYQSITNTPQRNLLAHNSWKDIMSFKNLRTNNQVAISAIDLSEAI